MTDWLATLGIGAFLFFTIKGLAWLAVPALVIWWKRRGGPRLKDEKRVKSAETLAGEQPR
jgi:hypothetical protein